MGESRITVSDLPRIEQELRVKLPEEYAALLLSDPFYGGVQEFYGSADEILEENRFMREDGYAMDCWPAHWLIVGDDGAGDDYFLDLSLPRSPVFFMDHERYREPEDLALAVKQVAPNVEAFVEQVRAELPPVDEVIEEALDFLAGPDERRKLQRLGTLRPDPRELAATSAVSFEAFFGCCRLARLQLDDEGTAWLWRDDRMTEPGTVVLASVDVDPVRAQGLVARTFGLEADEILWWRER